MTTVTFDQFKGIAPRVDPHALPDGFAQTATNTKLIRGILQAWNSPSTVRATTTNINTIRRYKVGSTENWLCWGSDVTSVLSLIPGDTKQHIIWSDSSDGIPKHSRNDKLVFTSNFVKDTTDHFKLGVPAPTLPPGVSVAGTQPVVTSPRTFVYAWAYRGKVGAASSEFSVEVAAGQTISFDGLDSTAPVATSHWPNARAENFKKFIFQKDPATNKYILIGRVTNEAETFDYNGKKTIKTYTSKVFKAAMIDAPTSAVQIINDDCSATTGWTQGTGWSHGASSFAHAAGSAGDLTRAVTGLTISTEYVIYLDTTNRTDGSFDVKLDSTTLVSGRTANQKHVISFTATATSHNIVISAGSTFDGSVDNLRVTDVSVQATAKDSEKLNPGERRYAYCFTYQDTDGVFKRTTLSAEATISDVEDGQTVLIDGTTTTSLAPATASSVRKRIFRKDKDTAGTWRSVKAVEVNRVDIRESKKNNALGAPLSNWTLVASSTPATPVVTALKAKVDDELTRQSFYYVYTYVTAWGEESAPSPVSDLAEPFEYQNVTLTTGTTAPTGYTNITLKRFYRTDSSGVFRVLFEVDIPIATASIVDDVDEALLGDSIITTSWDIPPGSASTPLKGLSGLPNGVLCGGWGNQVGFSEPGYPYAWPIANQFSLDYDFVGSAVTANGVLVCTTGTPYLCQGSDPSSMIPQRLEAQQACLAGTSIVDMGDYVIYVSPDGLVAVSGTEVSVISEDIITRDQWQTYVYNTDGSIATLKAAFYERRYLLFYSSTAGGTGAFLFDPMEKSLVSFTLAPTAAFTDITTDTLYLQIGTNIQKFDGGSAYNYTWKSKRFLTDEALNWAAARVDASAYPVTFKLYVDGTLKHTEVVTSKRAFRLPGGYRAFDFEVELVGSVDVRHVALTTNIAELR